MTQETETRQVTVGAEVRIVATAQPRHARIVGALGTVAKVIKSRGVVRVRLHAPYCIDGATHYTWDAFAANVEATGY